MDAPYAAPLPDFCSNGRANETLAWLEEVQAQARSVRGMGAKLESADLVAAALSCEVGVTSCSPALVPGALTHRLLRARVLPA